MAVSLGLQANFGLIRSNRSIDIPGASERVAQDSGGTANAVSAPTESARPVEAVSSPGDVRNDKTGAGSAAQGSQEDESASAANPEELSEDEQKQVDDLKARDTEVRNHEQAHAGAGGSYAGPPQYQYTQGPDGKRYITDGEVQIDTAPVADNPEATIRKMDTVIRAALAPAEPSSQDLAVARQARDTRQKARAELTAARTGGEGEAQDPVSASALLAAAPAYEAAARRTRAGGSQDPGKTQATIYA